jgi:hypothetical protein
MSNLGLKVNIKYPNSIILMEIAVTENTWFSRRLGFL